MIVNDNSNSISNNSCKNSSNNSSSISDSVDKEDVVVPLGHRQLFRVMLLKLEKGAVMISNNSNSFSNYDSNSNISTDNESSPQRRILND